MRLLSPMALAWLAIALPIVGLYFLKVRRRRQTVSTLMFWDQIFGDAAPRRLWQRLRHWLSLALQLAMVALLAVALAEPVAGDASSHPKHYVLVLDQSASMQATDSAPTRFAQARQIAHASVRAMREQDEATIVAAGLQTSIACGRTYHQPTLHRAIDSLTPTDAAGDLAEALRHAKAIDSQNQHRIITLITDGAGAAQLVGGSGSDVQLHRCGGQADNIAITGFAVRPRADNPVELQGMLRLANFTNKDIAAEVKLTLDGGLVDVILVDVPAGQEKAHAFRHMHTGGEVLRAELAGADALPLDNVAAAVLPAIDRKRVLLVSEGNLFLHSVLAAHPWMAVRQIDIQEFGRAAPQADIYVFDRFVPAALPAGPCLFVNPASDSDLWTVGQEIANPLISETNEASPLLRHVHLKNCTIHRARAITARQPAQHLVSSFEHPLLLQWGTGPAARVALAIDIGQSDLPWRTAFPILVQNVLNELAGRKEDSASSYQGGQAGSESDLRPVAGATAARTPTPTVLASIASCPWWVILVVVAVFLSATEWALHQRRRID